MTNLSFEYKKKMFDRRVLEVKNFSARERNKYRKIT